MARKSKVKIAAYTMEQLKNVDSLSEDEKKSLRESMMKIKDGMDEMDTSEAPEGQTIAVDTRKLSKAKKNRKKNEPVTVVSPISTSNDVKEWGYTVTESTASGEKNVSIDVKAMETVVDGKDKKKKPNFAKLSALKGQKYNYDIIHQFDYLDLIRKKPNQVVNGHLKAGFGGILDLITELAKTIVFGEITSAVSTLLHPSDRDYSLEILGKIEAIEENLSKLTEIVQLQAYQDAVFHRGELMLGISTATNPAWEAYLGYLKDYEAATDEAKKKQAEQAMKNVVWSWSNYIINGSNAYLAVETMLKLIMKADVVGGLAYPEIYDQIGFKSCVWKSESYPFRLALRQEDQYTLLSALVMTCAYWNLMIEDGKDVEVAKIHLGTLQRLTDIFKKFYDQYPCDAGTSAECTLTGHEYTLSEYWTTWNWSDRTSQATDEGYAFNKDTASRNKFYYGWNDASHIQRFPKADFLKALCAFFNNTKSLYEIFKLHYLEIEKGFPTYQFFGLDQNNWICVQGNFSWERRAIKKNHDKVYTQMVPMTYKGGPINTSTEAVVECNISNWTVPAPGDTNPLYKFTRAGRSTHNSGMYEICLG